MRATPRNGHPGPQLLNPRHGPSGNTNSVVRKVLHAVSERRGEVGGRLGSWLDGAGTTTSHDIRRGHVKVIQTKRTGICLLGELQRCAGWCGEHALSGVSYGRVQLRPAYWGSGSVEAIPGKGPWEPSLLAFGVGGGARRMSFGSEQCTNALL